MTINNAQGKALATAVKRVNNDPVYLHQRIAELEETIADLHRALKAQRTTAKLHNIMQVHGRPIGNLSDLARVLDVKPYSTSRWNKAGKLEKFTDAEGKTFYYLDQPKPARQSRKKSK